MISSIESEPSVDRARSSVANVLVLTWDVPTVADRRAEAIASFFGAATALAPWSAALGDGAPAQRPSLRASCLIVDAETLARAADVMPDNGRSLPELTGHLADHVFVHGFRPTDRHAAVVRTLSAGALSGVQPFAAGHPRFHVAAGRREWCQQFSGLTVDDASQAGEQGFVTTLPLNGETLIRIGDQPFFVQIEPAGTQYFFSAGRELADLDEPVRRPARPLSWFSRLMPLAMFLRGALGTSVWHNEQPRACFIIDDPALRTRHGFLRHAALVDSMRRRRFSSCIAFIPWNYRRSEQGVAALFAAEGAPGLCVHGCDHTRGEFATGNLESLTGKAQLALERMHALHRTSGIPFDPVMVFPQGLFSLHAMAALHAAGYLAAVNTDLLPVADEHGLRLRDLVDVAVSKYAGIPLFGRHYPTDVAAFAFDLFMGKPALAVEHHGFFRHGFEPIESFVDRLNALDTRLEWTRLGAICSRASLTRTTGTGEVQVRFYTNQFQITNDGPGARAYALVRPWPSDEPVPAVTVEGYPASVEPAAGRLTIRLSIAPGNTANVVLSSSASVGLAPAWKTTPVQGAWVSVRRRLCDFRDDHVATNRVLDALARRIQSTRSASKP